MAAVLEDTLDHNPKLQAIIPVTPLLLEMFFSLTGPLLSHLLSKQGEGSICSGCVQHRVPGLLA